MSENESTSPNAPAFKMNLGNISIALFSKEKSTADGKVFLAQDIVVEKAGRKPMATTIPASFLSTLKT